MTTVSNVDADAGVPLATSEELAEGGRLVVTVDGNREIGMFRVRGVVHAYANYCPHAGGPVCQGKILPEVVEVLDENLQSRGFDFVGERLLVACPWHGYEYDIETGEHRGDPRIRLIRVAVSERNGRIFLD